VNRSPVDNALQRFIDEADDPDVDVVPEPQPVGDPVPLPSIEE
jgi:hypothetical protein